MNLDYMSIFVLIYVGLAAILVISAEVCKGKKCCLKEWCL
jgi:hypothetical protein